MERDLARPGPRRRDPAENGRAELSIETGYAPEALDAIAATARSWAEGGRPGNLPYVSDAAGPPASGGRDVFLYFINGAKERAPASAQALIARLGQG